jgi:hypothetical protein
VFLLEVFDGTCVTVQMRTFPLSKYTFATARLAHESRSIDQPLIFLRLATTCATSRIPESFVKIITYDQFKPGVTMQTITPYLSEEVSNVWRLWKAGIVRENYARADEPGVVIVFECESVEQCKRYTDDFPLTKAGFIEWFHLPVQVALPLEALFRAEIDVSEPYDRTGFAGPER